MLTTTTYSQVNLVPNPSFEVYDTCPNQQNQVRYAINWFDPTHTSSDYYNACCTIQFTQGVPDNGYGNKQPQNGNAYCGFVTYSIDPTQINYREYIGVKLIQQLIPNETYCFSAYISPSGSGEYATNGFGILLLDDTTGISNYYLTTIPITPNAIDTSVIADTSSWKQIEFTISNSNANYLIMGCFLKDNTIHTQVINPIGYGGAYYYIDNVSLTNCSTNFEIPNVITNNNDGINDIFLIQGLQQNTEVSIYNRWAIEFIIPLTIKMIGSLMNVQALIII